MLINLPPKTEIDSQHVEKYIGISHEFNLFEMQNAIGRKDVLKVNRIVNYFADNPKNNPLVLTLGGLNSYFTRLLRYQSLNDKSQAATALGINPYFVKEYERASKNYSFPKLTNIISLLREYDIRSKGVDNASTGEGELLKEMMFRILH
jgi:DNA polymerase-3 subunit delta